MRRTILIAIIILLSSFQLSLYAKKQPKIKIEKTEYNLGVIDRQNSSPKVSFPVTITNSGRDTLYITDVLRDCEHCTTVDMPTNVIAPKRSLEMIISIDYTPFFSQMDYKTVTICTNDPKRPEVEINITADLK